MQDYELIFIHVSDIHFHPDGHGGFIGVDDDLRRQLINDVEAFCRGREITGVLVTGDIAFSGAKEEYLAAQEWLTAICRNAGCDAKRVWMVPGNHDVVRSVVDHSKPLRDSHERLRRINPEASPEALDKELKEYLTNDDSKHVFLRPLANYFDFAREYGREVSAEQVFWEDGITLNDGSTLRLRGITTPLISDKHDHKDTAKLVLGRFQVTCPQDRSVVYLTLAHHPPSWLLDEDPIDDYLKARVAIQLFGHKHRQRYDKVEGYIRLTAGATNPEEGERDWKPCYNYLAISVLNDGDERRLRVRVFPRIWHDQDKEFRAEAQRDGKEFIEWFRRLEPWASATPSATNSLMVEPVSPIPLAPLVEVVVVEESEKKTLLLNETTRMTNRFYNLPVNVQQQIARKLELHSEEDVTTAAGGLFARYFERAKERQQLAALWQAIEQEHGSARFSANPFST